MLTARGRVMFGGDPMTTEQQSRDIIRVTDDTTREGLAEAIGGVNGRAKRIPHVVGSEELPTEWDRRHAQINDMLTELETLP